MNQPRLFGLEDHGHPQLYPRSHPSFSTCALSRFASSARPLFLAQPSFCGGKLASLHCPYVAGGLVDVGRVKNQGQVHGRTKEGMLRPTHSLRFTIFCFVLFTHIFRDI